MSIVYRIMLDDCESAAVGVIGRRNSLHSQQQFQLQQQHSVDLGSPFQVKFYHTFITEYIWIIPLLCALVFPFLVFSMYLIALSYGHIEAFWPYISDTGALPPEAGFFDQLMDIAAILGESMTLIFQLKNTNKYSFSHSDWIHSLQAGQVLH